MNNGSLNRDEYDFLVLGSGEAGKYLAWTLAKQGNRVAVIERQYIGGSCPNIACLPSKQIIHSAKVASLFKESEEFGITKSAYKVSMAGVRESKRKMVNALVDMHRDRYKAAGVELILGSGRFVGSKTIEVSFPDGGKRILRGKKIIISTGTRANIESIPGLSEANPLTHVEALELDRVPEHLLVIGGGFVGLEFAQAMRRFGSRVTVIERNERLAHKEDVDVSEGLQDLFKEEGIDVILNAVVTEVEGKSGMSVKLQLLQDGAKRILEGTHILVATGRTPNTEGAGLELAGVEVSASGYIKVNERLETTAQNVWAVGDCAGSPRFTHIAYDDFRIVQTNLGGGHRVTTGRQVPACVFTDPEFARLGLTEREAKASRIDYRLVKIPMAAVPRARTLSETRGFMKALIDAKSDRILGFAAFGTGAGEVMSVVQVIMIVDLPFMVLRDAVFTHPTLAEGLVFLFAAVPQIAITHQQEPPRVLKTTSQ